ncbi:hypothetical protein L596_019084 [Steinernema carpocapsae]|uniref:Dynamitin n=1 Tax=Steinernema carpocapsae TaxID=34508 RepID=A0A4U5N6L2_STECR|nr:hypothetical protein L596_019084 [Steinernema carpocapsae]
MSIQKEDIFETPDYPEEEPVEREETFESEHIESIHVNMDAAMKKFKGRMINADCVDFSDSLWNRRRKGYGSGKYVLEVVGKEHADREHETVEQKFNRIHCELGELAEMVKAEKEAGKPTVQEVDVNDLGQLLEAIQKERISGTIPSESILEKLRNAKQIKAPVATNDVDFSNLEARLKRIEKFVSGGQPTAERVTLTPLSETVEELRLRIETVNPTILDGLESKLSTVLAKYQATEEKRQARPEEAFDEKVNNLCEMMTKWDGICMSLPGTVKRLHALTNLHEQARDFSANLHSLMNTKDELMKRLEGEEVSVFELKKEAIDMIRTLNERVSSVQTAVDSLK